MNLARQLIASYREAWQDAETSARWFLVGAFIFAARILVFSVSFPLYAKARGYDSGQIGLLLGVVAVSLFVFGIPITKLGSRGFTRTLLIGGPMLALVGIGIILAAPDSAFYPTAAGCLLVGMSSNVFWILGDPILAGNVAERSRAHVFALKFAILTAGFGVGGLLGGWIPAIAERTGSSEVSSFAAALVFVMVLDLLQTGCYLRIPGRKVSTIDDTVSTSLEHERGAGLATWGIFILMLVPEIGMATGYSAIRPYLSLFFDETFGMAPGRTGTIIGIMQLIGGLGTLLIPGIAARYGRIPSMAALRLVGGTAIMLSLGLASLPFVIGLFFVYFSVTDGTEAAFITEAMHRLPFSSRTAFAGLSAMLWSVTSAVGSSVSGFLQGATDDFTIAFAYGALGYFLSATWLLLVYPRIPSLMHRAQTS